MECWLHRQLKRSRASLHFFFLFFFYWKESLSGIRLILLLQIRSFTNYLRPILLHLNNYRLILPLKVVSLSQSRRHDIVNIWNTQFFSFFYIKILLYTFRRCHVRLRTCVMYNVPAYMLPRKMINIIFI